AANCALRSVAYDLRSAVCHYGEVPDSGSYKALAQHGAGVATASGSKEKAGSSWYVLDDCAVRLKSADEIGAVMDCEGHHVSFLMYRREDTKTINLRPHAA
ncbi:unnamed protein product, partial [Polarella glacialis]